MPEPTRNVDFQPGKKIVDIPSCSVCGSAPPLTCFYRGKPYCMSCLVTEFPQLAIEISKYLTEYLHVNIEAAKNLEGLGA